MGNRKLRRQVQKLLDEQGLGPLYTRGTKFSAYRSLPADVLKFLIRRLSVKPGDMINDCDGFNHVVVGPAIYRSRWHNNRAARTLQFDQYNLENGLRSCGCPYGPVEALTPEEVNEFFKTFYDDENIESLKAGGWWTENDQFKYDALKAGESLCDDRGMILEKFKRKLS